MSTREELLAFPLSGHPRVEARVVGDHLYMKVAPSTVPDLAAMLMDLYDCELGMLVADVAPGCTEVRYFFHSNDDATLVEVHTSVPAGKPLPAVGVQATAAARSERRGAYRVGQSNATMSRERRFRARRLVSQTPADSRIESIDAHAAGKLRWSFWHWHRSQDLRDDGTARLPHAHEDGDNPIEGCTPDDGLTLVEQRGGDAPFAHAWAFCQALEKITGCSVPPRAGSLRAIYAESERIRCHVASILASASPIVRRLRMSVAKNLASELTTLATEISDRDRFAGLCIPGGVARRHNDDQLTHLRAGTMEIARASASLWWTLIHEPRFLDGLAEADMAQFATAGTCAFRGPVARAAGRQFDLRTALPYGVYAGHPPAVPREIDGDIYALLRVYFAEIRASAALIDALLIDLPGGTVSRSCPATAGTGLGWAESPDGGVWHWLRVEASGRIARWCAAPLELTNGNPLQQPRNDAGAESRPTTRKRP